MDIRPIRTDEDHRAALAEIEAWWGASERTEEGDKLEVLVTLVELYEAKRWPVEANESFDPIATYSAIRSRSSGTRRPSSANSWARDRAHRKFSRRRALTVDMIPKISDAWKIPADLLVRPYHIERAA